MQQPHKPNINEMSATSANKSAAWKKPSVKINGLISIEPNKHDVPAKPARQTIASKREPVDNGQMNGKNGATVTGNTETDEIEFLLDEIKDLEVPACRTDSEQDFEIAGSRVDLDLSLQLDSPIDTSWYYSSIILLLIYSFCVLSLFFVQASLTLCTVACFQRKY